MAEVLTVPAQMDGYYRSSSPRCRSPQPSYTPPYEKTIPRTQPETFDPFSTQRLSPPLSSTASSPELSSLVYSPQSSSSSLSSSLCLDVSSEPELDDSLFFPVYDFGASATLSLSALPESEPTPSIEDDSTESPSRQSTPEVPEAEISVFRLQPADDTHVKIEPSRHVDYLSHDWKEEDIWASWRYMIGKRNVYSNGARLENASWRTWAKKKNGLRTVSADKLNWLKDCDVTWLYGPLSIGSERLSSRPPPSPTASPAEKIQPSRTKPILKKRSMSEMMLQKSLSTSSLLKQAAAAIESQQSNNSYPTMRPTMASRSNSDYLSFPRSSKISSTIDTSDLTSVFSTGSQSPSSKKHIHFNNQVQQCIAVETDDDDDMYGGRYDADDSSSDDGLTMARSKIYSGRSSERGSFSEPQTIAHLPSTTLKCKEEPVKQSTGGGFMSLNSFFSSTRSAPAPPAPETKKSIIGTKSYVLEDDDDMDGLDWEPSGGFASRRDSVAIARPKFGDLSGSEGNSDTDDFQLPNFNSWDDSDSGETGIFGRAVDAVNTARDIAHVLWNVGWSR